MKPSLARLCTPILALTLAGGLPLSALAQGNGINTGGDSTAVGPIEENRLSSDVNDRRTARTTIPQAMGSEPESKLGKGKKGDPADGLSADALATINSDYQITANDLLEFDVFGVPDMKRDVRVNASGYVTLPLIGSVRIAGMTGQQAEAMIATRYEERYLQNPQVSIFIKEFTTQRITVEGAVNKPGIYPVVGKVTLLRALALAGGQAKYADLEQVMLYRYGVDGDRKIATFDLEKVRSGDVIDPEILADDVIVVRRDASRTALRDSLFSDVLDTLNPFSR